jgi:hypothetical protein
MRFDSHNLPHVGVFARTGQGEAVRWVVWYDDATHDWEAYRVNPDDARKNGIDPSRFRYRGHGPLTFHRDPLAAPRLPVARAGRTPPRRDRCLALPGRDCEHYGCGRPATYCTTDYEEAAPELGADRNRYRKVRAVERHWWCHRHYRAPEEKREGDTVRRVEVVTRPQWSSR